MELSEGGTVKVEPAETTEVPSSTIAGLALTRTGGPTLLESLEVIARDELGSELIGGGKPRLMPRHVDQRCGHTLSGDSLENVGVL